MTNYAIGLDKIDIARGRSVPAPPYGGNISSTLRRNLAMVSGYDLKPTNKFLINTQLNNNNYNFK